MRRALLSMLLCAKAAAAAPRPFAIVYDAHTNTEADIEMESWLEFGQPSNREHHLDGQRNFIWWWGLRYGWLERLEVAAFVVFEQKDRPSQHAMPCIEIETGQYAACPDSSAGQDVQSRFRPARSEAGLGSLMSAVLEARWRPFEIGSKAVDPFVQLQLVAWPDRWHPLQGRLTVGASRKVGRWFFAGNLSYWDSLPTDKREGFGTPDIRRWIWIDASLGGSYAAIDDGGRFPALSLGAELWLIDSLEKEPGRGFFGERGFNLVSNSDHVHIHQVHHGGVFVGPTVSFTRGPLWGTAHLAFGLLTAPQLQRVPATARLVLGLAL